MAQQGKSMNPDDFIIEDAQGHTAFDRWHILKHGIPIWDRKDVLSAKQGEQIDLIYAAQEEYAREMSHG